MNLVVEVIAWCCIGLAGVSVVYWWITTAWITKWREEPVVTAAGDFPPITFLRPLKSGVSGLDLELQRFLGELRTGDQVVFGVDEASPEEPLCRHMQASGEVDVTVVPCRKAAASNPKISKLIQMVPHARHPDWIVLDSEFASVSGWMDRFRDEWKASGADAMTAGYRFSSVESMVQRLDILPILTTLWPGLLVVQRRKPMKLMLGAVIAVRRDDVDEIGGWKALGDFLADDNRLGVMLADSGKRVELSWQVATLLADPLSLKNYWHHQRRITVTYRACNPAGFAGSVCVQGVAFALLAFCLKPTSIVIAMTLLVTVLVRTLTVRRLGCALSFPTRFSTLEVVISGLVETACWLLAWFSPKVTWAGRQYRVKTGGRLEARCRDRITD